MSLISRTRRAAERSLVSEKAAYRNSSPRRGEVGRGDRTQAPSLSLPLRGRGRFGNFLSGNVPLVQLVPLVPIVLLLAAPTFAADIRPLKAGAQDKCPVCGMFVAKYPDFAAQIRFRDGRTVHFDGAKDMFTYFLNLPRYAPGKRGADVAAVFVTDYYDLKSVNGVTAYYVVGSDVTGPMGRELIPFDGEAEARDFLKDHRGETILRFHDVSRSTLKRLR